MNRVIFILLLIFVFTKSGAKDHSVNFAFVISGKVHHDTQKSLTIGVQNLAISKFIEFPLKIDSNKMFSGNIKLADSIQDVFVVYKDELIKLLVHSGDSIHMEFESSSLKRSIKFSGNAKEDNRLLIKFDTIPVIKTVPYSISLEKSKALSPD
ncbi:MAG: hypothetical protein JNL03_02245, partial [Prolixibacteraceae bacterium]|nr:hypothetical protein [Prolixibacteraceae bacterium]